MHTLYLHVIAGNMGKKEYINMFKKIFLGHELFCYLGIPQAYLKIAFKMQPLEKSISQIKVILSKLILA